MSRADRARFVLVALAVSMSGAAADAQPARYSKPTELPNPYRLVEGWPALPKSMNGGRWGEVIRVHVHSDGNIWIFHRCFNTVPPGHATCIERGDCGFKEFSAGWAAHTLAHESFHLRGFQDEGVTECYALQNTAFVAERLGVPALQAARLQAWIYVRGYPNEPEEYHSARCYSGGPLDLRPNVTKFP